jgi:competence protein ComEA
MTQLAALFILLIALIKGNAMKKLLLLLMLGSAHVDASPVNINTADAPTIAAALSGIGEKKAEAIVKYRQEQGPFKSPEELVKVSGIGEKILGKIKADVLVNEPGAVQTGSAGGQEQALPHTIDKP